MRRYRVARREPVVQFIHNALEASGARILSHANPSSAPFEIPIETPQGERLELICYAFLANKYRQGARPSDEHRFQVKYGSEFHAYHRLYLPRREDEVTLMLGVHLEEELFIACDPVMHEWTRFSRSVEFKTHQLAEAKTSGWVGWERERSLTRRHAPMPKEDARAEMLLAFTPPHFLQYVGFERIATGLDPGERLLLAERFARLAGTSGSRLTHPLEIELGLTSVEILDLIGGAFRLKAAVRGSAAEHFLERQLRRVPEISSLRAIDEDGKPDFELVFNSRSFLVECKNVLRRPSGSGEARVDFQKTRAAKNDPCSRYYKASQFDILAACLHPLTERWEYRFTSTATLPPHRSCPGRLSHQVRVAGEYWHDDIRRVLNSIN